MKTAYEKLKNIIKNICPWFFGREILPLKIVNDWIACCLELERKKYVVSECLRSASYRLRLRLRITDRVIHRGAPKKKFDL